jgi:hypothetical protein
MADPEKLYAPLFDDLRERVKRALERHPSYAAWHARSREQQAAAAEHDARIQRVMDEMRAGTRRRLSI